jgi:hypothetical protein
MKQAWTRIAQVGQITIEFQYPAMFHELKANVASHAKSQGNPNKAP